MSESIAGPAETLGLLEEWGCVFAGETDEDLKMIAQIGEEQRAVKQMCETNEDELKTLIRNLAGQVDELKEKTKDDRSRELKTQQEDLLLIKDQTSERMQKLKSEVSDAQHEAQETEKKRESMEADRTNALDDLKSSVLPLEGTVKLFQSISGIIWDDNAGDQVKGVCHQTKTKRLRPFCYDPGKFASKGQIVDQLWDIMWQDQVTV